jgi:hypothetical protein
MKSLQQLSMVVVITLMLATSALAGDIWVDRAPPPPPPTSSSPTITSRDIAIGTNATTQGATLASDSVEGIALNLLQIVLTLF